VTNINKITSSVILAVSFAIMAILPRHPASLLFIFVAGNKWVSAIRLALALGLFALSFGIIRPARGFRSMLSIGCGLIVLGLIAFMATSFGYFLYDYMKILDVMIVLESGIILCSMALESQPVNKTVRRHVPAKAKAKRRSKPKVAPA
jgi:hypothetical protein